MKARWTVGRGGETVPAKAGDVERWRGLSLDSVEAGRGGTTGEEEGEKKDAKPPFQSIEAGREDLLGLTAGVVVSDVLGRGDVADVGDSRVGSLGLGLVEGEEENVVRKLVDMAETDFEVRWPGRLLSMIGGVDSDGGGEAVSCEC